MTGSPETIDAQLQRALAAIRADRAVQPYLNRLADEARRSGQRKKGATFLHRVAETLETYGFEVAARLLEDKRRSEERQDQEAAEALLCVLDHLRQCPAVLHKRAIGRLVIKTLHTLAPQQAPQSPRHSDRGARP